MKYICKQLDSRLLYLISEIILAKIILTLYFHQNGIKAKIKKTKQKQKKGRESVIFDGLFVDRRISRMKMINVRIYTREVRKIASSKYTK